MNTLIKHISRVVKNQSAQKDKNLWESPDVQCFLFDDWTKTDFERFFKKSGMPVSDMMDVCLTVSLESPETGIPYKGNKFFYLSDGVVIIANNVIKRFSETLDWATPKAAKEQLLAYIQEKLMDDWHAEASTIKDRTPA